MEAEAVVEEVAVEEGGEADIGHTDMGEAVFVDAEREVEEEEDILIILIPPPLPGIQKPAITLMMNSIL